MTVEVESSDFLSDPCTVCASEEHQLRSQSDLVPDRPDPTVSSSPVHSVHNGRKLAFGNLLTNTSSISRLSRQINFFQSTRKAQRRDTDPIQDNLNPLLGNKSAQQGKWKPHLGSHGAQQCSRMNSFKEFTLKRSKSLRKSLKFASFRRSKTSVDNGGLCTENKANSELPKPKSSKVDISVPTLSLLPMLPRSFSEKWSVGWKRHTRKFRARTKFRSEMVRTSKIARPTSLGFPEDRAAVSEDELSSTVRMRKTISSEILDRPDSGTFTSLRLDACSLSSHSSTERKYDDGISPALMKKRKYFSIKNNNKNIFKKLLHPNYHERNRQYRKLFNDKIDDNDLFLMSFSCAYQREILCQGRMYISQRNICFYANIFGWETLLAVPFNNIAHITKARAALIFPNSIQVETKSGEKYFFASFVNREKTATVLELVLESIEKDKPISPEELWERMNPEREEKENEKLKDQTKKTGSVAQGSLTSPLNSDMSFTSMQGSPIPAHLTGPDSEFPPIVEASSHSSLEQEEEICCPCDSHTGKLLLEKVYPLSTSQLHDLLFTDNPWFRRLNDVLRNSGFHASCWTTDKDGVERRTCTYTMALNAPVGPKSCVVTESQTIRSVGEQGDGFLVHKETQNSGVPYADNFTVECSYCVTRVNSNSCRVRAHGGIHYKKNTWNIIKTFIEKNTFNGLEEHYAALDVAIVEECERRRATGGVDVQQQEPPSISSSEDETSKPMTSLTTPSSASNNAKNRHFNRNMERSISTTPAITSLVHERDYTPYIRLIIGLLVGLMLLNVLLLFRLGTSQQVTINKDDLAMFLKRLNPNAEDSIHSSEQQGKVVEAVLTTVQQLANDLTKLKEQMNDRKEL